jgi:hypothetical protein
MTLLKENKVTLTNNKLHTKIGTNKKIRSHSLFGWLVADGWCWFVLREEYCWLVAAGCW